MICINKSPAILFNVTCRVRKLVRDKDSFTANTYIQPGVVVPNFYVSKFHFVKMFIVFKFKKFHLA